MSETPQETVERFLTLRPGIVPKPMEEAIRAVLEDLRLRDIDCGCNNRVTRLEAERDALRAEVERLRTRAFKASHTIPGSHSTACITWGDDGQGNLLDGSRVPAGACSCGAWPAWLQAERDDARALYTETERKLSALGSRLRAVEIERDALRKEHGKIRNADAHTLTDYRDDAHAASARAEQAEAALRAVLERNVELEEMGRAWQESDEHKHADALRAEVEQAEEEATFLRGQYNESEEKRGKAEAALRPFADFADAWDRKPIRGLDDVLYGIHSGEDRGELRLSACKRARAVLRGEYDTVTA